MMKTKFHIGCSGYYYHYWRRVFYPKEVAAKNWLNFYSTVFNTVELNGTFYRKPELSSLKRNAALTGDDFLFSVKMSRYITHIKKLNDCKDEINEFQDLILNGLEEKIACFLFQLPPNFHYSEENLSRVIGSVPNDENNVVEFRHASWWNDKVKKALKKANITFCNVDYPGMETHFINTTSVFYMRFHGNPVLFSSLYSLKKLKEFSGQIPKTAKKVFVYFNNTDHARASSNARQLMDILNVKRELTGRKKQMELDL